jgi:hypothetical protein
MEHVISAVLAIGILVGSIRLFMNALNGEKNGFTSIKPEAEITYAAESIIASMYVYWKLRMKNSESEDEGVECFLSASESEAQFRALIDKSMNIKTEEEQEAAAVAKSPNVLPLKFN